jgi:hypothetical protein
MTNFADLKKTRSDSFSKLNDQLKNMGSTYSNDDDKFWKPEVDKAGNGYAVLRFLPAPAAKTCLSFVSMTMAFKDQAAGILKTR